MKGERRLSSARNSRGKESRVWYTDGLCFISLEIVVPSLIHDV
jgi:hypothetical protein